MPIPYRCPICHDNRTRFTFIYKLAQEVQLDPESGEVVYEAPELEAVLRPDGLPDVDVRCNACQYVAPERSFVPRTRNGTARQVRQRQEQRA